MTEANDGGSEAAGGEQPLDPSEEIEEENQAMLKLSAKLKNNQAYLMYWAIVCAFCIGVAACSTDALIGPKKGKAQKITGKNRG